MTNQSSQLCSFALVHQQQHINPKQIMEEQTYNNIRLLLIQMQSEEVREAQQKLNELSSLPHFFDYLYFILSNPQEDQWLKTMTSTFMNSLFLRNNQEQHSLKVFQALAKILLDGRVKMIDKHTFEKSISRNMESLSQQHKLEWQNLAIECLKDINNFDTAYLIIASMAVADLPLILHNLIQNHMTTIVQGVPLTLQNAALVNQMIKMWAVAHDRLKVQHENRCTVDLIINNSSLLSLIGKIYDFSPHLTPIATLTQGLQELNFLKNEAAQLHAKFIQGQVEGYGPYPALIQFTKGYLMNMTLTLNTLAQNRNLIDTFACDDLCTSFLSITRLYLILHPNEFNQKDDSRRYIDQILFPLLAIDDNERNTFEQNPSDFNTLTQDCCDKQTFGILKTQAAKLLQKYGDKVQECLKYAINRAIQSLLIKLKYRQMSHYTLPVLEVQTALLVLSIFSYGVGQFPEQTTQIKFILSDPRAFSLPPLQTSRIFTFMAYNYAEVYKNLSEGEPWINFALDYSAHPTTSYCAFDFFSNIVQDYFSQPIFSKFTDQICIGKLGMVWQVVNKIVQTHYFEMSSEGVALIIEKLFIRIKKELSLLERGQKKDYLDLVNCLRSFMTILTQMKNKDKQAQADMKKQYLITKIWPTLDLYQLGIIYDLQDQIVKMAISIANALDTMVPDFSPHLMKYIQKFKKGKYSEKIYLKLFNQYLRKCDFQKDTNDVIQILLVLKDSLLNNMNKCLDVQGKIKSLPHFRLVVSNTLLVIQNAIALFGQSILNYSADFFIEVSSICIRMVPTNAQMIEKTATGKILQSRVFNTLFLCHMHTPISSVYDTLKVIDSVDIYHGHDTKVLAHCICKQLFNQHDITAVVVLLSSLIKIILLSDERNKNLKKKKKKNHKFSRISDSIKAYEQYDKMINSIDSPFKSSEEWEDILSEMFSKMKITNQAMFTTIVQALSHETMSSYYKFVNFENLDKKKRVIRKVIGIKVGGQSIPMEPDALVDEQEEQNPLKRMRVKGKMQEKATMKIKFNSSKMPKTF